MCPQLNFDANEFSSVTFKRKWNEDFFFESYQAERKLIADDQQNFFYEYSSAIKQPLTWKNKSLNKERNRKPYESLQKLMQVQRTKLKVVHIYFPQNNFFIDIFHS